MGFGPRSSEVPAWCRIVAQMRSGDRVRKCLLFGVDRTYRGHHETDANDPKADIVELAKLLRQWQAQAGQVKLDRKRELGDHAPWTDTRSHLAPTGSLQRSGCCSRATGRCGSAAAPSTSWPLWSNAPVRWSAR